LNFGYIVNADDIEKALIENHWEQSYFHFWICSKSPFKTRFAKKGKNRRV
jgi:hypothetical protein